MTFSTFIPHAPRFHSERSSTVFYPQQRHTDAIFIIQNWHSGFSRCQTSQTLKGWTAEVAAKARALSSQIALPGC